MTDLDVLAGGLAGELSIHPDNVVVNEADGTITLARRHAQQLLDLVAAVHGAGLVRVTRIADVEPGDRLSWIDRDGKPQAGTVWKDPDGRGQAVMVELDTVGGELMPVQVDQPRGLWKLGR